MILRRLLLALFVMVSLLSQVVPGIAGASGLDPLQKSMYTRGATLFDVAACSETQGAGSTTDDSNDQVATFLKALSFQENGGAVVGTSSTGAQGKFQYIDSTWQSSARTYYPPASSYASANAAPEAVQDAVAYLEYVAKFKSFKNDVFKIAISHFYPVANTNASLLDVRPPGNVITPRQYAESVIKHIKQNDGGAIVLKYAEAPDFDKYLQQAGGAPTGSAVTSSGTGGTTGCECTSTVTQNASGKTIVIDPGHGPSKTTTDAETKLSMVEQPGGSGDEIGHAWRTANIMKTDLETKGYKVLLTKSSENDDVTFRDRANVADKNNADLALSIHGDSTLGNPGEIYVQKTGLYRGTGAGKVSFTNDDVAKKSQQYADDFKKAREDTSGHSVVIKDNDFTSRGIGMEPGNIPLVQLLSSTPWVYNEKKMPFDDTEYAKELEAGVEKAIPTTGPVADPSVDPADNPTTQSDSPPCDNTSSGTIQAAVNLAMKYAWSDGSHGLTPNTAYKAAIASHPNEYKGGCNGADCGAFVTRVMRDSGADPKYNYGPGSGKEGNTSSQKAYMDAHPEKYENLGNKTSTADLQPGDIAITANTHTYMYVGPQADHPTFKGDSASASMCDRMPNASNAYFIDIENVPFTWYRLKS